MDFSCSNFFFCEFLFFLTFVSFVGAHRPPTAPRASAPFQYNILLYLEARNSRSDAAPGVDMQLWTDLRWETVANNSAGPDAPEQLSYTRVAPPPGEPDDEADPLAGLGFSRLVFGETRDEKAINVRLKPKHPGGKRRDLGDLAADYLEVRVKYTHQAEPDP